MRLSQLYLLRNVSLYWTLKRGVDAQVYWTRPMFEELKKTISLLFPLDLQALEDYYLGKRKPFPKARSPPIKVQIYYDIPKELLSVDGLFLNSLVDDKGQYDFKDTKLIKDTLYIKSVDLFQKRLCGKEFKDIDPITYSDLRLLSRICLSFARAGRLKEENILQLWWDATEIMAEEWVKHSTRLIARGPNLAYNFSRTMIDLIKFGSVLVEASISSPDTL